MTETNSTTFSEPSPMEGTAGGADSCPAAGGPPATAISADLLSACIHCGICLPACPTYLATGREMESPRGRIYLLNQWQTGQQPLSENLAEHIDSCLGCLGCQTACPSGVQYEKILNQARPAIASMGSKRNRRIRRMIFSRLLPDYAKLRLLGNALRMWQSAGGRFVLSRMPLFKKLLGRLEQWQSLLPQIPKYVPVPRQSWRSGEKLGEIQLFTGCVMDIFYNQVNHACQRLLLAQRQIVKVPEQTCCGALAYHAGEDDIARDLAKKNIELLESTSGDVVVTAAGCGSMLKGYGELLHDDPEWAERAHDFSKRVKDITEFLGAHEFAVEARPSKLKVAYHAACHLAHAQNIHNAPEKLLENVPGITLIPLKEAEHCCGSAGIFNLTHPQLSETINDRKIACIKETGADTVVTTNPGCMMQIDSGLKAAGLDVKVRHLADFLDEVYGSQ